MKKYKVFWETVSSPVRPYYDGTVEVFALHDKMARARAIRKIMSKGGFSQGEIRILAVV